MLFLAFSLMNAPFNMALSWSDLEVSDAVEMAVDEMNSNNKIKQKVELVKYDDEESVAKGMLNAQMIVDKKTPVVIGNKESFVALPASSTFNFNKVVAFNTSSTNPEIGRNQEYVFRHMPDDKAISKAIAHYLKSKGYKRVLLSFAENGYGQSFAKSIKSVFEDESLEIVDRYAFSLGNSLEFKELIEKWENYSYDSILFIGYPKETINFLKESVRLNAPTILSEAAYDKSLLIPESEGVIVPMLFYPDNLATQSFFTKFRANYGRDPTFLDVFSYDAAKVIEQALEKGYEDSDKLAEFIASKKWNSIIDKKITMQSVAGGQFKNLGEF